jgi:tetratricopeptide (TPR) repeat protein
MKHHYITPILAIAITLASCTHTETTTTETDSPRAKQIAIIKANEAKLFGTLAKADEKTIPDATIKSYSDFATKFPKDTLAPDFLFKAAEVATSTKQYGQALNFYRIITDNYHNFKLLPESYYLQAFLLDNYMNKDAEARPIYEMIIKNYPTITYANDAKAAINNLGKSDEDLIKEFKKKNNQ